MNKLLEKDVDHEGWLCELSVDETSGKLSVAIRSDLCYRAQIRLGRSP